MATIKAVLFKSKTLKRDGSHPIMIRVTHERQTKYLSTGFSAQPNQWDESGCCVSKSFDHSTRVNHLIKKKVLEVESIDIDLESIGDPYSLADLIVRMNNGGKKIRIVAFWQERIERLEKTQKLGNARCYAECLKKYQKFSKGNDWTFDQFNLRKLNEYHEYLQMAGLKINSISYHLRTFRAVWNLAIKEELVDDRRYPFKHFLIRTEATQKRSLTFLEIKKIQDTQLLNTQLQWARDLFMFSFYCMGMNFVDMAKLKWSNIHDNRIQYRRSKTHMNYDIAIHPKLAELIEELADTKCDDGNLLPISNGDNEYKVYRNNLRWYGELLKRLGVELKLSIPLTSYVARHSWATIAKRKGVSVAKISDALGHSSERTTQIYLDSFSKEDLDKVNDLVVN